MTQRFVLLSIAALLFFGLAGCDKIIPAKAKLGKSVKTSATTEVKGTVIARVNNYPITLEELNQEIDTYNKLVPDDKPEAKITTKEQKVNYLKNEMVRRVLLYQEGLARGLDRKEDVVKAIEKTKQDLLVLELVREEAGQVKTSSQEIEDYYNKYKSELRKPEERRIREIVVATEQEAKDIMIQLLQGADFATLTSQRSIVPSAKDGGDLGFISKGKKSPQFDDVAFSETLEVGRVSNIFKGPEGYYILKLEEKKGGEQPTLSEMWSDIERGLTFLKQQQKIEELIGKLSRESKLEIYEGEIK